MTTGPDFRLIIGAEINTSVKQIREDLKGIVSELNTRPAKLKFTVDPDFGALGDIEKTIKNLTKAIGNTTFDPVQNALSGIEKSGKSLDKVYKDLKKTVSESSGVSSDTKDLSAVEAKYEDLTKAVGDLRAAGKNATDEQVSGVNRLKTEMREMISAIDEGVRAERDAAKASAQAAAEKETQLTKIQNLINSMESKRASAERIGIDGDGLREQQALIESAKTLKKALEEGSVSAEDASKSLRTLKTAQSEVTGKINEGVAAKRAENAADADNIREMKEKEGLLRSAKALLAQLTTAENNWTAARLGKGSDHYKTLSRDREELRGLVEGFKNGVVPMRTFEDGLESIKVSSGGAMTEIRHLGENTSSFIDKLKVTATRVISALGVATLMGNTIGQVKKMTSAVIELDTAMTELRKVTDETESTYARFLDNAATRTKVLGASMTDVITATADFARLGYSISEAEVLSNTAALYKNVGDGITNISEASESIIATMQAFGIEASDAMTIVDKFNEVGNNYAISSRGVGEALIRSSAALHAANNTIDETIALATAANTVLQSPEKVGTTLKTVSMFLRSAKAELDDAGESSEGMVESVSKLRSVLYELTDRRVDIQLDANTYKNTYEILKEISGIWHTLTDVRQANILEMLGGKRNANAVAAILENFSIAENALETSINSVGSAVAENEKFLDSIQGRINIFKASYENLSRTIIGSGLVKHVVDGGTKFLDLITALTEKGNALPAAAGTITAVVAALRSLDGKSAVLFGRNRESGVLEVFGKDIKKTKVLFDEARESGVTFGTSVGSALTGSLESAKASIAQYNGGLAEGIDLTRDIGGATLVADKTMTGYLSSLRGGQASLGGYQAYAKSAGVSIDGFGLKAKAATVAVTALNIVTSAILSFGIAAIISGAAKALDSFANAAKKAREEADDTAKKSKEAAESRAEEVKSLDELIKKYDELRTRDIVTGESREEILRIQDEILTLVGAEAAGIDLVNGALDEQKKRLKEIRAERASQLADEAAAAYRDARDLSGKTLQQHESGWLLKDYSVHQGGMGDAQKVLNDAGFAKNIKVSTDALDMLKNNGIVSGLKDEFGQFGEQATTLSDRLANVNDMMVVLKGAGLETTAVYDSLTKQRASYQEVIDSQEAQAKAMLESLYVVEAYGGAVSKMQVDSVSGFNAYREAITEAILANQGLNEAIDDGSISAEYIDQFIDRMMEANFPDLYQRIADGMNRAGQETVETLREVGDMVELLGGLSSGYKLLATAIEEMSDAEGSGGISPETISALAKETENYLDYLYEENGVVKLNIVAWQEYAQKDMGTSLEDLRRNIELLEEEKRALEAQALAQGPVDQAISGVNDRLRENNIALNESRTQLDLYEAAMNSIELDVESPFENVITALERIEELTTVFNEFDSAMNTLADLQEVVANGFIMDANAALEFANVYPEILDSAQVTADGQLMLDENVVNNFIDGKEHELRGQIQADIEKLEADKAVLIAKKDFAQAQLDLVLNVGEGEGQITKEVAEYRVNAGNAVAQALIEAGMDEAEAYRLAAAAMSQNSKEFDKVATEVANNLSGNFDSAARNAANALYTNVGNMQSSMIALTRQAHAAAEAIEGISGGKRKGTTVKIGGATGAGSTKKEAVANALANFDSQKFVYNAKKTTLDDFATSLKLDISSYTSAIAQIDGQIAVLKALGNTKLQSFSTTAKEAAKAAEKAARSGSTPSKSGSKSGSTPSKSGSKTPSSKTPSSSSSSPSSSGSDGPTWFELEYKRRNHLVNMEQQNMETYLAWLTTAFNKAFQEGIVSLDDFYKYQEEIFKGMRDLFQDYLGDIEFEISMKKDYNGETEKIKALYKNLMTAVEKELASARRSGLTDTDDYVQELRKKWEDYASSLRDIFNDLLKDIEHDISMRQIYQGQTEKIKSLYKEMMSSIEKELSSARKQGLNENGDYIQGLQTQWEGYASSLRDIFKDSLSDIEHEISMRENYDGEQKKIISLYKTMLSSIEKELASARKQGLDESGDYIQELQSKWQSYTNSIKDMQDAVSDNAKSATKGLVEIRLKMLKQDIENEKKANSEKLSALKEFYNKQKEMLQDTRDEEKYEKDQINKRKSVTDLQLELTQLERDDSAQAQRRKLELQSELAKAKEELNEFERDRALEILQEQLDEEYRLQEEQLEKESELLEEKQNNAKELYEQALEDIRNGSVELYEEMIQWNQMYGDGIDDTIKEAWEGARSALSDYYDLYGKYYEMVKLANATNQTDKKDSWDSSTIKGNAGNTTTTGQSQVASPSTPAKPPASGSSGSPSAGSTGSSGGSTPSNTTTAPKPPSLASGASVTVKKTATRFSAGSKNVRMASFVPGGSYTVYRTSGSEVLIGRNGVYTGWINKNDIVGYAKGTPYAEAGVKAIDEVGSETIFESANGNKYKMFSGGEKVLNARASDFLYSFATAGAEAVGQLTKGGDGLSVLAGLSKGTGGIVVHMGDINIRGNADDKTVSQIRREQRSAVDMMLREINRLDR